MPTSMGFLRNFRNDLYIASQGDRKIDKLTLVIYGLLDSFPMTARRKFLLLDRTLRRITDLLIKGSVICVNRIKYVLVDSESLLIVSHKFESGIWKYFKPKKGDVFVDIGAHIGKYALGVASILKESLVIAVEPSQENYQALIKGIKLNNLENVIALNVAAWDRESKLKLFIGEKAGHHSVKIDRSLGFVYVEAEAMDGIIKQLDVKHVDWITIDVEGAELEVLRGLEQTLRKHHPRIIVEVNNETCTNVSKFLEELGYAVYSIKETKEFHNPYLYCTAAG